MRAAQEQERRWRVGELARATGLTVRTLHHYDSVGLLVPSERSESGYRLYGEADVRRLYRIVALRRLGLSLDDVAAVLDRHGPDVREAVRGHLRTLEREVAAKERLRRLLVRILDELDREGEPSGDRFIEAIEVMTMHERYYTPEQLEQLERRRRELGDDAIRQVEAEWAELIAKLEAERARGTDPADERVRTLARRWGELVAEFTGGDPGIWQSLRRMYEEEGAEKASRGLVSSELAAYVARAAEAGR